MSVIAWMLIGFGVFCAGFHVGCWWRGMEAELAEQQRAVADCRRRERIKWPSTWGEG